MGLIFFGGQDSESPRKKIAARIVNMWIDAFTTFIPAMYFAENERHEPERPVVKLEGLRQKIYFFLPHPLLAIRTEHFQDDNVEWVHILKFIVGEICRKILQSYMRPSVQDA